MANHFLAIFNRPTAVQQPSNRLAAFGRPCREVAAAGPQIEANSLWRVRLAVPPKVTLTRTHHGHTAEYYVVRRDLRCSERCAERAAGAGGAGVSMALERATSGRLHTRDSGRPVAAVLERNRPTSHGVVTVSDDRLGQGRG